MSNIPDKWHLCDGTNGTPDLRNGEFLEGSSSAKSRHSAGLPNIKGTLGQRESEVSVSGAFSKFCQSTKWTITATGSGSGYGGTFDASKGTYNTSGTVMTETDSPFGKSNTVQPKSYTVMYIMKIKA